MYHRRPANGVEALLFVVWVADFQGNAWYDHLPLPFLPSFVQFDGLSSGLPAVVVVARLATVLL